MAHSEGEPSLPRKKRSFTVQASPFNGVKLDLALIAVVGLVVWMVHDRLIDNALGQLLFLATYGVLAGVWVIRKTRRIVGRHVPDENRADQRLE